MATSSSFTVNYDTAKIAVMLGAATDETSLRAAQKTRDRARTNLRAAGRWNTGALGASIVERKVTDTGDRTVYSVGSDKDYAAYQEYGSPGASARPGSVLRFKPKGSAVYIFRPRVSGFSGAFFMRRAYLSLSLSDFCS